jgi:hypothetical protein
VWSVRSCYYGSSRSSTGAGIGVTGIFLTETVFGVILGRSVRVAAWMVPFIVARVISPLKMAFIGVSIVGHNEGKKMAD